MMKKEILLKYNYFCEHCNHYHPNGYKCDGFQTIRVDKRFIPENGKLMETYETETELIVIGDPTEKHNCDIMGCSSVSHVRYRIPLENLDPSIKEIYDE